jgi:hypothetical protein
VLVDVLGEDPGPMRRKGTLTCLYVRIGPTYLIAPVREVLVNVVYLEVDRRNEKTVEFFDQSI